MKAIQERQARINRNLLDNLAKEHKVEEVQMMTELWTKVNKEEEEEDKHVEREKTAQTVPPPPDCPICYETMTPPTRIFQCGAGHLVCGACKPKLQVTKGILHSILNKAVKRTGFVIDRVFQECPSRCGLPLGGPAVGMENYIAQIRGT